MSDKDNDKDWFGEGWEAYKEEVCRKSWPPVMVFMTELAFYGGGYWFMRILEDEGASPEILQRLRAELEKHDDHVRDLRDALDEAEHSSTQ